MQNQTREEQTKKVDSLVREKSREGKTVEMSSGNTKKLNQGNNGDRKGKRKVFNDGYNSSNQSLESGADNSMLASQEIQGPASPAKTLGNSVVFEKLEEKEKGKEKTDQQQQSRQKCSVHLFTTNVKPRLRWTTKLHAHFVDAINKLGGPQKATPKTLWDAMALEGLDLHHVKSHLQKYRMGKLTVRDWPDVPRIRTSTSKPSTGVSIGTSARNLPFQAYGDGRFKGNKVKKTYKPEMEVQGQGQLYMKLKDAEYQRHLNDLIQAAQKKLSNQYISGAHAIADAAGIFRKILAGEKTMATTPSLYSALENRYPKYDTLDKIKGCLVIPKQVSSSATYQPQNLVDSATQDFITSQGYLYPMYNSNDAINGHAGLQEQTPSFLSQNAAYTSQPHTAFSGFQPQSAAHEFHPQTESYSASSGFPTSLGSSSGNAEYLQGFQPPSTSNTFQPQNVFNNYQSQNACSFQPQNPTYNYQPQSSAYSNQLQNVAYAYPPQNAAAYVLQPQNTASSATNNLPTSNANYSETAYLDDLTAALAAIGSTSVAALLEDPVDAYMVWDNPEPNANDNGNNGHPM